MKRTLHMHPASGRLLAAMTALLAAARTRRCKEWLGELHTLPARRDRAGFALPSLPGVPRLAVTVRLHAPGRRRSG